MLEQIMLLLPGLLVLIVAYGCGVSVGENNKLGKTVYVVINSYSYSNNLPSPNGTVFADAHVHATKSSAEKFLKTNQENDPNDVFVLRECIVYDCEK